jgi:hypothetical protein
MYILTKYYYDDQIENDIGMHVAFMGERLLAIFGQIFGREKLEG